MSDQVEFEFPDEKETKAEASEKEVSNEVEIEVVDDTPEPDRNRAPMKEPPAEVTDDELTQYSESVKKRIQHFSKGYHDERRAKEAALREREEALRLAQNLVEENQKLQGSLGKGQEALLAQAKQVVANEVDNAKVKYKQAYESGDADALVTAQEELTAAKIKADRVNNYRPAPLQQTKSAVQPAPEPKADPQALAWQEANQGLGSNRRMTAVALEIHTELVEGGVSPTSSEYYEKINSEVRKVFPEAFSSEKPAKKSAVVAPATRSTAPRKIVLTQSQVNLAKRLGLPLEVYAKQVAEEMRKQNG